MSTARPVVSFSGDHRYRGTRHLHRCCGLWGYMALTLVSALRGCGPGVDPPGHSQTWLWTAGGSTQGAHRRPQVSTDGCTDSRRRGRPWQHQKVGGGYQDSWVNRGLVHKLFPRVWTFLKRSPPFRPQRLCCLIRLVSSVTWLKMLRRSAISWRILRSACMTVVWSRPPNCWPILGSDSSVSSRHRYIAI